MNSKQTEGTACNLSNAELIDRVEKWVHKLAETGGQAWTLRVPVDFNHDPDMLIIEVCKRFSASLPSKPVGDVERVCQECGGKNPTWYADNDLFNKVNGSPNGIICPSCFEQKANKMGIEVIFKSGYAASPQKGSDSEAGDGLTETRN